MRTRAFIYLAVLLVAFVVIYVFAERDEATTKSAVEQIAYTPPQSEIPTVNPDESDVLLDDLPMMSVDEDALELALMLKKNELELEARKAVIWAEPWEETFQFVITNPTDFKIENMRSVIGPGSLLKDLPKELRLAKLLDILNDKESVDHESVKEAVRHYCEDTFFTLPDVFIANGPFEPIIGHPGIAIAMPYLLYHIDENGDTLALIHEMQMRNQDTKRRVWESDSANEPYPGWVSSDFDFYVYAGAMVVLDKLAESADSLSPDQQELVGRYSEWRKEKSEQDIYQGIGQDFITELLSEL